MTASDAAAGPLRPSLRIVVLGNSTAMYVRPRRRRREDGSYGELLARRLRDRGVDATVVNEARWWDTIDRAFQRWEEAVNRNLPDVVILNYGMGECQPNVFPTSLLKRVTTWRPSLHPIWKPVRSTLRLRLYRFMVWYTPRMVRLTGTLTWRLPPRRFRAELRRMIAFTRKETAALVVVLTPNPPGPFLENLMPGLGERATRYGDIVRELVDHMDDPGVRLVDAASVVEKVGWRRAVADGLHFTAQGHAAIADALEPLVLEWATAAGHDHVDQAARRTPDGS